MFGRNLPDRDSFGAFGYDRIETRHGAMSLLILGTIARSQAQPFPAEAQAWSMAFVSRGKFPIYLAGGFSLLIGILVAGTGLFLWTQKSSEDQHLRTYGQAVNGIVLRKTIQADRSSDGSGTSYRIGYRFAPIKGQPIAGSADIDRELWDELRPGAEIEIVYMPEKPSVHRVERQKHDNPVVFVLVAVGTIFFSIGGLLLGQALRRAPAAMTHRPGILSVALAPFGGSPVLLIGSIALIAGLPVAFAGAYQVLAQRAEDARFEDEAQATEGIVLAKDVVKKSSGSNSNRSTTTYYRVSYRYLGPFGEEIVGTSDVDLDVWDRWREREPIAVNYLPESPWMHRVEGDSGRWARPLTVLVVGLAACLVGGVFAAIGARDLRERRGLPAPMAWVGGALGRFASAKARRSEAASSRLGAANLAVRELPAGESLARGILRYAGSRLFFFGLPLRWAAPLAGGVFLVAGLAGFAVSTGDLRDERRFAASGLIAEARVTAKTLERAKRGENSGTAYVALYRFTAANGQSFEGRYVLSAEEWESITENAAVPVRYLPDEPWRHRPANEDHMASAAIGLGLSSLIASIGGGILVSLVLRTRHRRRLLRTGIGAEAAVVSVEPSWLKVNNQRQWQIRYRFRDAAGHEHEGISGPVSPDEAEQWRPGDPGAVRYDPERPQDSLWTDEAVRR